jgi:predicted enzyme related to lactoylglutathione lyase
MGLLVYFEVDSLDEALTHAIKMGSEVLIEKTEMGDKGLFAVIKDPFGNTLVLWEWTKK